jgi:hypothetical protein
MSTPFDSSCNSGLADKAVRIDDLIRLQWGSVS